jgi:hypothetical protein
MSNIAKPAYNRVDHTGKKFGQLTVIEYSHTKGARSMWRCLCDCGKEKIVNGHELVCGDTRSCGCLRGKLNITHGEASGKKTKEYKTWTGMATRCYNTGHHKYPIYGGRGISICDRWRHSYENFLADMGRAPSLKHSIDRPDVNGNYEPGNARWATPQEQHENKQNSVKATINGQTKIVSEWARLYGISEFRVYCRIKKGWTPEDAILKPSLKGKDKGKPVVLITCPQVF